MTTNNGQLDLNHWIIRLVALIIDGIIVSIPAWIIAFVIGIIGVALGGWAGWFLFPLVWSILIILYYVVLDVIWGGTVGKRIMGLQVQTVTGGRITFGQSFIRNISKFLGLVIIDWLIAVITSGNDKRQKLTDRWAGTTVVQTKQPFASVAAPPPPPPPPT